MAKEKTSIGIKMKDLTPKEAANHGIITHHQIMDNEEARFRLMSSDGTGYIRTESGEAGSWQNSHVHQSTKETYIVQKGWIAFAELLNGGLVVNVYEEDDLITTQPSIAHNVYLSAKAIIHTVKHGKPQENDWIAVPELDAVTKNLDEQQILNWKK